MGTEGIFRAIFALLIVATYLCRLAHKKQLPKTKRVGGGGELSVVIVIRLWAISLALYPFGFEWFDVPAPFPHWIRWVGVLCMALCMPLSLWIYRTLGMYFSPKLQLLDDHRLVSSGPYRLVRHPMYSTLLLSIIGTSCTAANFIVAITGIVTAVVMLLRIKREEEMLLERFGESYCAYMKRTGAIVPKLHTTC